MDKKYLKEREVAELIGRSIHTLRRDRFEGKGIPYVKIGAQVIYPTNHVEKYLQDHLVEPERKA